MKKVVIPVIIIVFGVCAYFGFKAASKILPARQSQNQPAATTNDRPINSQKNYLFIHVNDLTTEKPELISIWVGFVNESVPPQLIFMPIFPVTNTEIHDRIKQSFSLNSVKNVNQRFLNQLKTSFDFDIYGYILSDDTGVSLSNQWITGVESPVTSIVPETDEAKNALLLSEQNSWLQFCSLVTAGTSNSYFSAINWSFLLPDHFSTNLDFKNITLLTDQIVHAAGAVPCEVLSND